MVGFQSFMFWVGCGCFAIEKIISIGLLAAKTGASQRCSELHRYCAMKGSPLNLLRTHEIGEGRLFGWRVFPMLILDCMISSHKRKILAVNPRAPTISLPGTSFLARAPHTRLDSTRPRREDSTTQSRAAAMLLTRCFRSK